MIPSCRQMLVDYLTAHSLFTLKVGQEFTLHFMNFWFCEVMIRLSLSAEVVGIYTFSCRLDGAAIHMFCGKIWCIRHGEGLQLGAFLIAICTVLFFQEGLMVATID
eukprot:gene24935-31333_t